MKYIIFKIKNQIEYRFFIVLLTECRDLDIPNVTKGYLDTNLIKKAVWAKNKDDLQSLVLNMPKIQDRYSDDRVECHYEIPGDGFAGEV